MRDARYSLTHTPLTADGALSGEKAVYSPVLVKSSSEIFSSFASTSARSLRDTEGYASAISIVPENGMMVSVLHWGAVMLQMSVSTFSTVTFPRRWVFASTVFCEYTASHGVLLPDENAKKPLCPPAASNVTWALVVFIMNCLAPASGDWDTEDYTGSRFKTFQMSHDPPPLPRE